MAQFPTGTVTFLFTDIEDSTQLLQQFGNAYALLLGDTTRGLALLDQSLVKARHLDDDVDVMLNTFVQAAGCLCWSPAKRVGWWR